MSDEYDIDCECIMSFNMRRLLNFIRQSQNYCTETECIDYLPSADDHPTTDSMDFTTVTMIMLFGVILYLMRPNTTNARQIKNDNMQGGNDRRPPPAPPSVN